jgi:cell division protein FtsX
MPGLPNPWVILGGLVAVLVIAVGAFFYGQHVSDLSWKAALAKQQQEAADQLLVATQKADAFEKRAADLNTQSEHDHAVHQVELSRKDADLDQLARDLDRVRGAGGQGGDRPLPKAASAAAVSPGTAAPDTGAVAGSYGELAQIAADAVALAEAGRQCHDWANQVATLKQ